MTFRSKARRAGWLLVIAAFAFGIVSAIRPSPTSAYGLISTRSIQMSSSEASGAGGSGGGNNVIYKVSFTTANTSQNIGAIVIKFCDNNPIIGDTCSVIPGFNTNYSTLAFNPTAPAFFTTGWSINNTLSNVANNNVVAITKASTQNSVSPTTFTFELGNGTTNGFTNPNTANHTFFARILIYNTTNPTISQASENTATDAGGIAMSTANVLNVVAKVQEQLTFCVYTGANCAAGGVDYPLGDSNQVLAATNQEYLNANGKFDIASNALNGVIVRLKGDTLTSGTFTITPNGNSCTPDVTTTSTEQFGIRVVSYGSGQFFGDATAGSTTPTGSANDFSCLANNHKFDPTFTNTTYGQPFVRTVGATDISTTNFELAAKAASTTEAGVYTTKLQMIATATY
jgi:hypothetical protein